MKREKWFLAAAAAVAAVMAFVPGAGSGLFGLLALPLRAVGWCLRVLSLSGGLGNGVAIVLYVLVCAVPLVFWWSGKRRTEDWLLFLLSGVLAVVLYYMVNPDLRHSMMQNPVGDAIYASAVWSTLVTWGVLKLLYSGEWGMELYIYRVLRSFLLLCAASCLIECFGTGTARLVGLLKLNPQVWPGYHRELTVLFLALGYLTAAVEYGFAALVLYRGAGLLTELERDPFGPACVEAAERVSRTCRNGLSIICLTGLMLNVAQILLAPLLQNISVTVTVPVAGLAVCFAMLAVTKLLVRGKELKDDNDLFV